MSGLLFHATAVARDGWAALLTGPSGAGKSDLGLRLIDRGWMLVADDYVRLAADAGRLVAHPPETTRGLMEVRGIGLLPFPPHGPAPVALVADLGRAPERLPEAETTVLEGVCVPFIALEPFGASAPLRLELAFTRARERLMKPGS